MACMKKPNLPVSESIDSEKFGTRGNDPLLYWRNNKQSKPLITKSVGRFLYVPPGSIPSDSLETDSYLINVDMVHVSFSNNILKLLYLYFTKFYLLHILAILVL